MTVTGNPVTWEPRTTQQGHLRFHTWFGKKDAAIAYAWAEVEVPAKTTLYAGVGSDDAVRIWLNGKMVHERQGRRGFLRDDDIFKVELAKGRNTILAKVVNHSLKWEFSFRFMNGQAAMFAAAATGNLEGLDFLLGDGVDPNCQDESGRTPLHVAAYWGEEEVARELIWHGGVADIQAGNSLKPAAFARRAGHAALAERLEGLQKKRNGKEASVSRQIDWLCRWVTRGREPGVAVMVLKDGKPIHMKGYGLADVDSEVPITPQTPMPLYSISKQFVAAAVLLLVNEGTLSLDDSVRKFIPEFPAYGDRITLRHLLTHTSGVHKWINRNNSIPITTTEFLEGLTNYKKPLFEVGTKRLYANMNYVLVSFVIERASGKSYEEFMRERMFTPLGMMSTFVNRPGLAAARKVARGYVADSGQYQASDGDYHLFFQGGGDLIATLNDLRRWHNAYYSGDLIPRFLVKQAEERVVLADGSKTWTGMGLNVGKFRGLKTVGHGGMGRGFRAAYQRYVEQGYSIAVLANCSQVKTAELQRMIAELFLWKEMLPRNKAKGFWLDYDMMRVPPASLIEECERGVPRSCYLLGSSHENGNGAPRDSAKAFAFFEKSCRLGELEGCQWMGLMIEGGRGVKADPVQAVKIFKETCEKGFGRSCASAGVMLFNGVGGASDYEAARKYFLLGRDLGDMKSYQGLGAIYEFGSGVPKDDARARSLYKKSCDGGCLDGCASLERLERKTAE